MKITNYPEATPDSATDYMVAVVDGALSLAPASGATVGGVTIENQLFVDGNRTDTYTADGGLSRPYKTVLAALAVVNADTGKSWCINIAPGTYADNLTITGPRYLRINDLGGVVLSGTILINSGVGSYDRIEFVGTSLGRAEKGPALTISGKITATRSNDSLIYVGFSGAYVTGQFEATTCGTWVLMYHNCRVNGAITGTFDGTDAEETILIETHGFNEFAGVISGKTSLYNCNGSNFYAAVNTTPWYENRLQSCTFAAAVTIAPQGGAASTLVYVDALSYKSLAALPATLTGATYSHLQGTMAVQDANNVAITGGTAAFTGSVSGGLPRVEKAATGSLSAAECRGTLVSNKGQTGDAVINLPTLAEGLALVVHLETTVAQYYRLDPEVAAVIRFDGDTLTAGYYVGIASAIAGAEIIFKAVYNNAGTLIWDARTVDGYWLAQT